MVGGKNVEIAATEPSQAEEGENDEKKDQASSEELKYAPFLENIETSEIPNELTTKIGESDLCRTEDEYYLRVNVEDMAGIGKVVIANACVMMLQYDDSILYAGLAEDVMVTLFSPLKQA